MAEKQQQKKSPPPAYKSKLKELRPAECAMRLTHLPNDARWIHQVLISYLPGAAFAGIRRERLIEWLARVILGQVAGQEDSKLRHWISSSSDFEKTVDDAVEVLRREGLVTVGHLIEVLPVEAWENDRHFLAGLALRIDS